MKTENEYLREKIKTNEDQFNRQIADKDAVIMILEKERGELLNYKEASECQFVAYEQKLRNRDNILIKSIKILIYAFYSLSISEFLYILGHIR